MLALLLLSAIDLVELHGPAGQRVFINPPEITTVREPLRADLKHFSRGTHCIVVMADGKFVAVRETCDQVRQMVGK